MLSSVEEKLMNLCQRKTSFYIVTCDSRMVHFTSSLVLGKKTVCGLDIDTGEDVEIPLVDIVQIREEKIH